MTYTERNVVNTVGNVSSDQNERFIQLLEQQLAHSNQQNNELTKKLDQSLKQIEVLTEQVRQLTKALYGSKSEKSKYQAPDGQGSLFDDNPSFNECEHTEEQSTPTVTYTVVRKLIRKNGMILFVMGLKKKKFIITPPIQNATVALVK